MFGEEPSESPRLPSPWQAALSSSAAASKSSLYLSSPPSSSPRTPDDFSSSHVRVRRQSSFDLVAAGLEDDFDSLSLEKGSLCTLDDLDTLVGVETIGPEVDSHGHIEYKLKLGSPTPHRLAKLVTQLRWRLVHGGGSAMYELGVLDSGVLVGLTKAEMEESLNTLGSMLAALGGGDIRIARVLRLGHHNDIISNDSSGDSDSSPARRPSTSSLFPSFSVDAALPELPPTDPSSSLHDLPPVSLVQPISIRQTPYPERTPEERAQLKRQKRDARRLKRQAQNVDGNPPPSKPRAPRNNSEHAAPSEHKPFVKTFKHMPNAKTLKRLAAKAAAAAGADTSGTDSPLKPRPFSANEHSEKKYVVEAIVEKRGRTRRAASSEDDEAEDSADQFALDVGSDEEGWDYLDFDSLPRLRGGSMTSSFG